MAPKESVSILMLAMPFSQWSDRPRRRAMILACPLPRAAPRRAKASGAGTIVASDQPRAAKTLLLLSLGQRQTQGTSDQHGAEWLVEFFRRILRSVRSSHQRDHHGQQAAGSRRSAGASHLQRRCAERDGPTQCRLAPVMPFDGPRAPAWPDRDRDWRHATPSSARATTRVVVRRRVSGLRAGHRLCV